MNSVRSLVRQAAKPLARNAFAKRTIYSTRAALSDAIFVVICQYKINQTSLDINLLFYSTTLYQLYLNFI